MITNQFVTATRAAGRRMPEICPPVAHVLGSESVYATAGAPVFGTDVAGIVRVRDAKQAAPPRGELR